MDATKTVKLDVGYVDLEDCISRVRQQLDRAVAACPEEYRDTLRIDREEDRYDDTYTHIFTYRRPLNKEELEKSSTEVERRRQLRLTHYNRLKAEFDE
jgi:hypothetical protein